MTRFITLLSIALAIESAAAFAPAARPATANHATAIHLVPEQGRQLVAFSQDYLSKKAKESASRASNLTSPRRRYKTSEPKGMTAAARSFVTRLLHYDDQAREKASLEVELNPVHNHPEEEVLYPIVGFTLVDGHAVPTPEQEAACHLHLQRKNQEQEFGTWSSPQGGDSLWM